MSKCKFNLAWRGRCENDADESGYCAEHKDLKCCSCGNSATHQCSSTMGLVCGAPLCDDCEHTIHSNGCNGAGWDANTFCPEGLKSHCRKDEQVYMLWIYRSVPQEDYFDVRTCEHTNGIEIAEDIVFCKKCGKILERLIKNKKINAPFTDKQVTALNQFQTFGMMYDFTCANNNSCERSDDNNWGVLTATNDGWVCPCGKYKQKWAWEFMIHPEVLTAKYDKIKSQFNK